VNSHIALGCSVLLARPFGDRRILVSNDSWNRKEASFPVEGELEEMLVAWCHTNNVSLRVLQPRMGSLAYAFAIHEELSLASEVISMTDRSGSWIAELMIPPNLRRVQVLANDNFSFAPVSSAVYLSNPERAGRFASEKPELREKGRIISVPNLGAKITDVEMSMMAGSSGLGAIPEGSKALIVMARVRLEKVLRSPDLKTLIHRGNPATHFVFVGVAGEKARNRVSAELTNRGHTCQFVEFSENLLALFSELKATGIPVVFVSPTVDSDSGGTKRMAARVLPYVGVEPCNIDLDPELTFRNVELAFEEIAHVLGWPQPAN